MTTFSLQKLIVGIGLCLGIIAALGMSFLKPISFDTSISFAINRINRQDTVQYQYDGYYAIQADDLFSQTVMSWFMTPSVLLEIYDVAKIDPQIQSIGDLTSRFKVKKYSPQNIAVSYSERDQQTASKLADAIISIVQDKAAASNQTADNKALFQVKGDKPVVVQSKPIWWLTTLIGLIVGALLGLTVAYGIGYFKAPKLPINS